MPVIISSTNDRGQDKEWMEKYSHLLKPPLQIGDQVRVLPQTHEPGADVS